MLDFFRQVGRSFAADWRPGVEIAILAGVLYLVFRFLRGIRGAAVLRGAFFAVLAALAVLFLVAEALALARVVWVVERLIALAAIGVLVIFQPEIRRGLVRLRGSPFVNLFVRQKSQVVDEIVEAAGLLSEGATGAIVAVERDTSLADYVKGGVRLDADVSSGLLGTLFAPGSRMRDGAAVIRGAKVAAAGCLLPLSDNLDVAKSLGARHRAAVGLTEQSDAVAVVVSGETGKIALAIRGELMQDLSVEALRAKLAELCSEVEVEATVGAREG